MIDIGAGTMDILWYDSHTNEHFKAVAPSPVRTIGEQILHTRGALVVTGVEMGGGPVSEALKQRARQAEVLISEAAAATLHHDRQRVREWGLTIAPEYRIAQAVNDPDYSPVTLGDVQPDRLNRIVEGLGLPTQFDAVVLCAQDHGVAPPGVSHLDFRHNLFQNLLDRNPKPHALLFRAEEVPPAFNRLRAMAQAARALDSAEVYVMDSGMAAMIGAAQDMAAHRQSPVMVLDIATSHTVAAVMREDTLAGLFEYHTSDLTLPRLEELLVDLAYGNIDHARILAEGGHGAYVREAVGYSSIRAIIATGPKRRLVEGAALPIIWGAPWGDNMMTGTVGLLEALRCYKRMAPLKYL